MWFGTIIIIVILICMLDAYINYRHAKLTGEWDDGTPFSLVKDLKPSFKEYLYVFVAFSITIAILYILYKITWA